MIFKNEEDICSKLRESWFICCKMFDSHYHNILFDNFPVYEQSCFSYFSKTTLKKLSAYEIAEINFNIYKTIERFSIISKLFNHNIENIDKEVF